MRASHANSPTRDIVQLAPPRWPRVFAQIGYAISDGFIFRRIQPKNLLLNGRQDDEAIAHLRFRSRAILVMASSNGTPTSPEAFASWYSRIASVSSNSSSNSWYSGMLITTAIFSPFSLVRNCFGQSCGHLDDVLLQCARKWTADAQKCDTANWAWPGSIKAGRRNYSSSPVEVTFKTAKNASCGMSTWPTRFMRFLPSFCFSRSLRLRLMSPP
jgi:hypothetical protein